MKSFFVNNITFLYDNLDQDTINRIYAMVYNNYDLFLFDVGDTSVSLSYPCEGTFYCPDIEDYINKLLVNFYLEDDFIEHLYRDDVIYKLYGLYMQNTKYLKGKKKNVTDYSLDYTLSLLAVIYYVDNDIEEDLLEFLKFRDKKEIDKIISWISNQYRYTIYDRMINEVVSEFPSIGDNLEKKLNKLYDYSGINPFDTKEELSNRFYVDENLRNKLFIEYLEYIDAPQSWIDKFNELVNSNKIIKGKKSFYKNGKITLAINNTLDDLVKLAHEFAHFLSCHNSVIDSDLDEFTSIYHEFNMQNFLVLKGFL